MSIKPPKISCKRHVGVTDTLHPIPHLASPNIGPLCVNVKGSVLVEGGAGVNLFEGVLSMYFP